MTGRPPYVPPTGLLRDIVGLVELRDAGSLDGEQTADAVRATLQKAGWTVALAPRPARPTPADLLEQLADDLIAANITIASTGTALRLAAWWLRRAGGRRIGREDVRTFVLEHRDEPGVLEHIAFWPLPIAERS